MKAIEAAGLIRVDRQQAVLVMVENHSGPIMPESCFCFWSIRAGHALSLCLYPLSD